MMVREYKLDTSSILPDAVVQYARSEFPGMDWTVSAQLLSGPGLTEYRLELSQYDLRRIRGQLEILNEEISDG